MKTENKLTAGLFRYRFTWGGIKATIKDFFIMLTRIKFVIKHGYYPQALYNTDTYFVDMFEEIFQWYMDYSDSCPAEFETKEEWNKVLAKMRTLNQEMREEYFDLDIPFVGEECRKFYADRDVKQREFFDLFCKYFHNFWD